MPEVTKEDVFLAKMNNQSVHFGYMSQKDRRTLVETCLRLGLIERSKDKYLVKVSFSYDTIKGIYRCYEGEFVSFNKSGLCSPKDSLHPFIYAPYVPIIRQRK